MAMEDISQTTRFQSLIQPIKELAASWDIDVADQLDQYLDELEHLRVSLDGGITTLNFAEAALLIQGSTQVYGKKVESLYQLVMKSLEFLSQKKQKKLSESTNGDSLQPEKVNSKRGHGFDEDDIFAIDEDHFLLLDQLIEEGDQIDLPPKVNSAPTLDVSSDSTVSTSSLSLLQRSSLLLQNQSIVNDGSAAAANSSLRLLQSSYLDQSGALLLGNFRPSYFRPLAAISTTKKSEFMECSSSANHSDVDYGFDDVQNDEVMDIETHLPVSAIAMDTQSTNAPPKVTESHRSAFPSVADPAHERMFRSLDPHGVASMSRPARPGNPFIPNSKAKKQTAAGVRCDPYAKVLGQLSIKCSASGTHVLNALGANRKQVSLPVKGLWDSVYQPLLRQKRKQLQRLHFQHVQKHGAQVFDELADDGNSNTVVFRKLFVEDDGAPIEPDHAPVLYDFDGFDNDYEPHSQAEPTVEDAPVDSEETDRPQNQDIASNQLESDWATRVRNALNNVLQPPTYSDLDSELSLTQETRDHMYGRLCRSFLEGFTRGASAFAQESQLSQRVSRWTQKLEPKLLEQEVEEGLHPFQINDYADKVLLDLQAKKRGKKEKQQQGFDVLVRGQPSREVARVFLACLQLANLGNIEVFGGDAEKEGSMGFSLQVLSNARVDQSRLVDFKPALLPEVA